MYEDKMQEVSAGLQAQQPILDIYWTYYVLPGELAKAIGRPLGTITFAAGGKYDDYDYLILESGSPIGYVEIKERAVASTDYGDMICPSRKTTFALLHKLPFYMVQRYTDGVFVLDITKVQPYKVDSLQRKDWQSRGDKEEILHSYYDLKLATKI